MVNWQNFHVNKKIVYKNKKKEEFQFKIEGKRKSSNLFTTRTAES